MNPRSGPWVTPTQDYKWGDDPQDPKISIESGLYAPEYEEGKYKNNIFVSHVNLDLLEQSFKNKDLSTLGGRMFEISITILHEYSHYLNVQTNKDWKQIEFRNEQGALFEKSNFNQFSYTKNNGGFGAKNQYYQNNIRSPKLIGMSLSDQSYFNNFFLINSASPPAQTGDPAATNNYNKPSALGGAHE